VWSIGEDNRDIGDNELYCQCGKVAGCIDWRVVGEISARDESEAIVKAYEDEEKSGKIVSLERK